MPIDPPRPPAEQLDWQPALSLLPVLAAPHLDPGHLAGSAQAEPGVFDWPHVALAPQVEAFIAWLHDTQVIADADWTTWLNDGGQAWYEDPGRLGRATLAQSRMLLTVTIRADRFTDGHLRTARHDGHLVAILTRLRDIVNPRRRPGRRPGQPPSPRSPSGRRPGGGVLVARLLRRRLRDS